MICLRAVRTDTVLAWWLLGLAVTIKKTPSSARMLPVELENWHAATSALGLASIEAQRPIYIKR